MSRIVLEHVTDAMHRAFRREATEDIGCIVYTFDRSEDGRGGGFSTTNCDSGDAMVAIKRIKEKFDI